MRGATDIIAGETSINGISIHAPHARSDNGYSDVLREGGISIHAPHARSDCN